MSFDKVLVRKAQTIERCVARAREEYAAAQGEFASNLTRQDAAILNLQRVCEAALDMAQRVISLNKWGLAETSKDLFAILLRQGVIDAALATTLSRMVGFRNIAVHDYETLNVSIVESVIKHQTQDLLDFSQLMVKKFFQLQEQ